MFFYMTALQGAAQAHLVNLLNCGLWLGSRIKLNLAGLYVLSCECCVLNDGTLVKTPEESAILSVPVRFLVTNGLFISKLNPAL